MTLLHTPSDFAALVLIAGLILLVPVCVAYLVVLEMMFFRLRRRHPEHFKRIGEPSVFFNNSVSKADAMMRYLLDRDYLEVPDERAVKLGERSRQLLLAGFALFGLSLVAFAAFGIFLYA